MKITAIYVAPNGDDAAIGSLEQPIKTVENAKLMADALLQLGAEAVHIILREGTYYLSDTLRFSSKDKTFANQQVTLMAHEGEYVTLSGGTRLDLIWGKYNDKIWCAKVDKAAVSDFYQLFINGKRQTLARYPKAPQVARAIKEQSPWPHTTVSYEPDTFKGSLLEGVKDSVIHLFPANYWGNLQWEITGIDVEKHTINLGTGGYQINDIMQGFDATGIDDRSVFYVENLFGALSEAGEWYYDREEGMLYVIPEVGVDLNNVTIEVEQIKEVIAIKGDQRNPMTHFTLKGLRIAHTKAIFLQDYEAPSLGDWTIHRSGSVILDGARDCKIEGCYFDQVGGTAIFVNNYNRDITIRNNIIAEAGESGVCIVGDKQRTIGSNKPYPARITVTNNIMYMLGRYGKQVAGVFISVSEKNTITHNHLYDLPRAAICINDGTWGGHYVGFNYIHDTVKETGDHGPFNSWGRDRYWCKEQSHGPSSHGSGDVKQDAKFTTIVDNNYFEDYKGWGIDLDDGSSNYHVKNNLCIGIGVKLREGNYRTIENNIFIHCANPPGLHVGYEENEDIFRHNIVVMDTSFDNPEVDIDFQKDNSEGALYEFIGPPMRGRWLQEADYNLFYNNVGAFKAIVHMRPLGSETRHYDLAGWQAAGFDKHSLFADPHFIDVAQKDFRLQVDSPAFKVGFTPFPLNQYGLTKDFSNNYYIG